MTYYRVNYGFHQQSDNPELEYGNGFVDIETEYPIDKENLNTPEMLEILRTIGLSNGYDQVGLQAINEIELDEDLEIKHDNSDRFSS